MNQFKKQRRWLILATALIGIAPGLAAAHSWHRKDANDTVYTMSNAAEGNEVLAFRQNDDGTLQPSGTFATGGLGAGSGLGSQGALVSSGNLLFVVNAGSDDLSVFRRFGTQLHLIDRMPSGGIKPVSVTVDRNLVYVLNAGSDNIAGFVLQWNGKLRALPGSEQGLSDTGVGGAQIQFSQDGRSLIVTEKATNKVVTFALNRRGIPENRTVTDSPGPTPFGFALAHRRLVLVSEAAGGAPGASTVSSYFIKHDGSLIVLDPAVATGSTAACWVAVTPDGRYAYTTNTGSNSVSTLRVHGNGRLDLVTNTSSEGQGPIDMIFTEDGDYLHVLNAGTHNIATFKVSSHGGLEPVGSAAGLPAATNGLAAF